MILIGLGANLPSNAGDPLATCEAALAAFPAAGITIQAVAPWYRTQPVPVSDQPWFVNTVASVATTLAPPELLARLQDIEHRFGRVRTVPNAARPLDLDLLAYNREILTEGPVLLPHPRLHERAFVLAPLADLAPHWQHPILGETAAALLARVPQDGLDRQEP
jgi:2-amino-4-hydroxy-6-hydroxymethyldihydropteridine diphosphokinase